MGQLTWLDQELMATERGTGDPRMVLAILTGDPDGPRAICVDPIGQFQLRYLSDLVATFRYDFKHESWVDEYETTQQQLAKSR